MNAKRIIDRAGWAMAGALGLALVLVAARGIHAGPLDPPGPPASTGVPLDKLPPDWHQALPANDGADSCHSSRFECVLPNGSNLDGNAVLDHQTGLVWERNPSLASTDWWNALDACEKSREGGSQRGWRLPTVEELSTLNVPTVGLPPGHPFNVPGSPQFWSSTTVPRDVLSAYGVVPTFVGADAAFRASKASTVPLAWCVRAGTGPDTTGETQLPHAWWPGNLPSVASTAPVSKRFQSTGSSDAAVDQETGLVWQTAPDASTGSWTSAVNLCYRASEMGEYGWRLPTLEEIRSLYLSSNALPPVQPFTGISGSFWVITTDHSDATKAYVLDTANIANVPSLLKTATTARHWCVRGGHGYDG
ncbi:MAG: DUF1566 domain-containing protein [Vicinamibacterales bacterium]